MKKPFLTFLIFVTFVMVAIGTRAVPAWPGKHTMTQPDGTQLTLRLCGDEFYNFWTTDDGYTVVRDGTGWVYATLADGHLTATAVVAHDSAQRTADERALLAVTPRGLTDRGQVAQSRRARAEAQQPSRMQLFDYSKFRGLIVLVQPKDVEFAQDSPEATRAFYDTMVNTPDFTGFTDHPELGTWTGSVRDYYRDNSMGQFDPHFDVVGPVTVRYKANTFYPHGGIGGNYDAAFWEALTKLNDEIDFSQYDTDDDGTADMVFFLVAGYGSHYGNDAGLLWPHMAYNLSGTARLDGVRFGLYACSTEMGGLVGNGFIDGIGTICHEFGHVLGLPDLYDTDYAQTGGTSHHPGNWDIMASGNFHNNGRTPAGYSLYERYSLGFAAPQVLEAEGGYTLPPLGTSNAGFLLPTAVNKEYFLLENRQPAKWDTYLPGHGMVVARVDSTRATPWYNNEVNNDPLHNYYELLRAGQTLSGDHASDPFPGSMNITECSNFMLHTWDGTASTWSLEQIAESEDGVITFALKDVGEEKALVETFDPLTVSTASPIEEAGDIATWRLLKCSVVEEGDGHAVAMVNPSSMTMMTPVHANIGRVAFKAQNTSNSVAHLRLYYSLDGGESWVTANTPQGGTYYEVGANATTTINWNGTTFTRSQPVQFRIGMIAGSKKADHPCRIDDFTIYYSGELGGGVTGDVNGDGTVDISDVNAVINVMLGKSLTPSPSPGGEGSPADINGDGTVDIADVNMVINIMLGKN